MTKHVLLIEDEPNIIEAITFILLRKGIKVDAHSNGASALETVKSTNPDAVILDVMLPNRSGFDILQDIREDTDFAEIPVMMLTARGQTKDRERAMELGATAYMTKPFSNSDVIEAITALLEGA